MNIALIVRSLNNFVNSPVFDRDKIKEDDLKKLAEGYLQTCLKSSEAENFFGDYFGCNVYKFTKRMAPIVSVKKGLFHNHVTLIQFAANEKGFTDEYRGSHKIKNLNCLFGSYDYEAIKPSIVDFSAIKNIQFKL